MNNMTSGMQLVQDSMNKLMQMQMEREVTGGTKRPATTVPSPTNPMTSPVRRQRTQNSTTLESLITQDSDTTFDYDITSEMDHLPTQMNKPSQSTATAKEQERAEKGGER